MAESMSWGRIGPIDPILPVPVDGPSPATLCPTPREPGHGTGCTCNGRPEPREFPYPVCGSSRSHLLMRVAELADAQRSGAAALRDAAKAASDAGASWRTIAGAAGMNHVTLFQQVQAGGPVVAVRPGHRRGGKG